MNQEESQREIDRLAYLARQELRPPITKKDYDLTPSEERYEKSPIHLDMGNGNFRAVNRIGDAQESL